MYATATDVISDKWIQTNQRRAEVNLYHIKRTNSWGYDNYSDAVVVASNGNKAKRIHPDQSEYNGDKFTHEWHDGNWVELKNGVVIDREYYDYGWTTPDNIKATLIGEAKASLKEGDVICASFHAG